MAATPTEVIERFYYKGFNKGNEQVLAEILDENVRFRGTLGRKPLRGRTKLLKYVQSCRTALSNLTYEIEDIIVTENRAAVRLSARGVQKSAFFGVAPPATGKGHHEVSWTGAAFFTLKDGLITEMWALGDVDSIKNQLDAPPDATAFAPLGLPTSSSSSSS